MTLRFSNVFLAVLCGSVVFPVLLAVQIGLRATAVVYATALVLVFAMFTVIEIREHLAEWRRGRR